MSKDKFVSRHNGPGKTEIANMLQVIQVKSIDALIEETIPASIRLKKYLNIPAALSEYEYLNELKETASKNKTFKTYIGLGYYNCIIPPVIQRNVLENPGWYTAYTPYQAEISQGRLEALLNFQTMVIDLTGMEIANASLLDEATAAAEAMLMQFNTRPKEVQKRNATIYVISKTCFPQTIEVLKTRATPLGIELLIEDLDTFTFDDRVFGCLMQYPDADGEVKDYKKLVSDLHTKEISVAVAADLLSLALLSPPGEWGADIVVGNTQRFGVPLGYGGPHAAYFATKESYKRSLPGRIIGVSVDAQGNRALRMALQTREQHIRRDKATSNICTAQALLAVMASMYAVYHGPEGLKSIAENIHRATLVLANALEKRGCKVLNQHYFDTIKVSVKGNVKSTAEAAAINFRYIDAENISISIDQTTNLQDLNNIVKVLSGKEGDISQDDLEKAGNNVGLKRKSPYLTHPVFSSYHSETDMMRYMKRLENKDLSLTHSMISLGSCTMKLNAVAELYPISWGEFANIHPFVPVDQALGYQQIFNELESYLCEIIGFAGISFQPNSGAQGEYAGLLMIKAYHESRGDSNRDVVLIPSSAHGTNPASAAMLGMNIVVVKCDEQGNIDVNDLKEKAEKHKENLSALMVTYPSTHGVYEEGIISITKIIHENGGQVYMDGANMNAQVGLTSPGNIGADVCHLNLHKTFAIPHGGGGPGVGPIGVAAHLKPFLPGHPLIKTGGEKASSAVSAAPWGSALILLISYAYIKMLGKEGVTEATKIAILNANYIKERLKDHYNILYVGKNGRVAHEMILDCKKFKKTAQVEVADIAKRLIDYGFHAPTVSFPVADTLMVEPTESESKAELDRFCDAMIEIRKEIKEIEEGKMDALNNVLKNAPHTVKVISSDEWKYLYTRKKAAYPLNWLENSKFWSSVGRVDNAYGDRNLICSCVPIENYENELIEG